MGSIKKSLIRRDLERSNLGEEKCFCKFNYIFCTSFYSAVNRAYIFLLCINTLLSPIIQKVMCESLRNSYK